MLNRAWHLANRMPAGASQSERLAWHLAHASHCGCRPVPKSLAALVAKRGAGAEPSNPSMTQASPRKRAAAGGGRP